MCLEKRITRFLCMGVIMLVLVACTGWTSPEPPVNVPAMGMLITETNCPSIEVKSGTQISWTNKGSQVHVVQSEIQADGSRYFDSGELKTGDSFSFIFTIPGIYRYQCLSDGSMTATVNVLS